MQSTDSRPLVTEGGPAAAAAPVSDASPPTGFPTIREEIIACLPQLRAFARSLAGQRELADDLVQDAIVRALSAAASFQPGTNFRAWIFTILRNLFFTERRKSRIVTQSIDVMDHSAVPVAASQEVSVEFDDFRVALMPLPPEQREALVLVGASGVSYEDAARICGCAVGTVKSRVSRARRALAQLTGRDAEEDRPLDAGAASPSRAMAQPTASDD